MLWVCPNEYCKKQIARASKNGLLKASKNHVCSPSVIERNKAIARQKLEAEMRHQKQIGNNPNEEFVDKVVNPSGVN